MKGDSRGPEEVLRYLARYTRRVASPAAARLVGQRPSPEDKLRIRHLRERDVEFLLWHLCDSADQLMRKRTTKRRADLGHLTRRS